MIKDFNKNNYRFTDKKVKIILDTDPGVDDIACFIYAMNDENVDIKLVTAVAGNIPIEKCVRNALHVMELFNVDYPLAVGAKKALTRISPTAEFIHSKEGMGGYTPPEKANKKPISLDAVSAMHKTIMENDGDVIPVMLGPATNLAELLIAHPEVKEKIPKIVIMGGAPYGNENYPAHISFNLSTDPEAVKVLLDSDIPILMCPSHMGRIRAHLDEPFVQDLVNHGDVGKFLYTMYSTYWEPNYPTKRITTNDSCALFALVYPKMFKIKRVNVEVNCSDFPGRTVINFDDNGKVEFIDDLDKPAFLSLLLDELEEMKDIKLNI